MPARADVTFRAVDWPPAPRRRSRAGRGSGGEPGRGAATLGVVAVGRREALRSGAAASDGTDAQVSLAGAGARAPEPTLGPASHVRAPAPIAALRGQRNVRLRLGGRSGKLGRSFAGAWITCECGDAHLGRGLSKRGGD